MEKKTQILLNNGAETGSINREEFIKILDVFEPDNKEFKAIKEMVKDADQISWSKTEEKLHFKYEETNLCSERNVTRYIDDYQKTIAVLELCI